ncbi:mitofilin family membrane protein [Rhodobacteraceae bacterium]|nr:mitofilin family membrane protein [Paracoccaceae bacterium]
MNDESSSEASVLIEGEAVEVVDDEKLGEHSESSADETESFPPMAATVTEQKRGSVFPMILGGLLAGGIGFGAAFYWFQDRLQALNEVDVNASVLADLSGKVEELSASIPTLPEPVDTSGLETGIASLEATAATMLSDISTLKDAPPVDLSDLSSGIASLSSDIAGLTDRVGTLELDDGNANAAQADQAAQQLAAFKAELAQLVSDAETKIAAAEASVEARVAAAQAEVTAAEAKAAEVEAAAVAAAANAEQQARIAEIKAAVEGGASFSGLIDGVADVPAALVEHAESGVPTLVTLQNDFPSAARAALSTAQTIPQDASTGDKLAAFLKRQTNARSLAPKEGDGTDAVLSRAEALLATGDLDGVLSQVAVLPEDAQNAMSGWLADARTRQSALQSVDALSAQMN